MSELEWVVADVVFVIDDISLEDAIGLPREKSRILHFEGFFIFLAFVLLYDFIRDRPIIHDHVVEGRSF